jgi:hypothetical protein
MRTVEAKAGGVRVNVGGRRRDGWSIAHCAELGQGDLERPACRGTVGAEVGPDIYDDWLASLGERRFVFQDIGPGHARGKTNLFQHGVGDLDAIDAVTLLCARGCGARRQAVYAGAGNSTRRRGECRDHGSRHGHGS